VVLVQLVQCLEDAVDADVDVVADTIGPSAGQHPVRCSAVYTILCLIHSLVWRVVGGVCQPSSDDAGMVMPEVWGLGGFDAFT